MADAHIGVRQYMQEKPPDELFGTEGCLFVLVAVSTVSVPKSDETVLYFHNAVVCDGNTVSVATQVVKHLCGAAEGRPGVNYPILFPELIDQTGEAFFGPDQFTFGKCCLEKVNELAAEDFRECLDREEVVLPGMGPSAAVK